MCPYGKSDKKENQRKFNGKDQICHFLAFFLEGVFNLCGALLFILRVSELHWILFKVMFGFIALFQNNERTEDSVRMTGGVIFHIHTCLNFNYSDLAHTQSVTYLEHL